MATFSQKVEKLCEARGWDRAELARQIDISRQTAGNYWDGNRKPFLDSLPKLAQVLGVSADYLIDDSLDDDPAKSLNEDERRIVETIRDREIPFIEAMDALLAKARKLEQSRGSPLYGNVRTTGPDADTPGAGKRA